VQNVIRFPTGSGGHKDIRKVMLDKGFRVFDWTASYEDSYIETEQGCYDELMSGIDSDCEIILMHHKVASYQALPKTIETLREMGYEFAVITEETAMWYF
ncbi:MAG: hypothetical protein IJC18_00655, partial [Clostridia bacterium]|nr:hypothetical protein [Clostridia bacterium]